MCYNPVCYVPAAFGFEVIDPTMKRIPLDLDDLVRRYRSGTSEKALAEHLQTSRPVIRRRLLEAGISPRNRSAAELMKWSQMSAHKRNAQVAAAHEATRGRPIKLSAKLKGAATRERLCLGTAPMEFKVADALRARGLETVPQQAIGPYNCDLGAFPVAVEIFCGNWHWHGRHMRRSPERIRYILNAGWHLLMIRFAPRERFTDTAADYVVAYVQESRCNPAAVREYRVIQGAGELLTGGSLDDDEFTIKPALRRGLHRARRDDQTTPR